MNQSASWVGSAQWASTTPECCARLVRDDRPSAATIGVRPYVVISVSWLETSISDFGPLFVIYPRDAFPEELAGAYHRWYDNCRVTPLGEEPVTDVHRTRLWLNDATGVVLRSALGLLGVSAPERM